MKVDVEAENERASERDSGEGGERPRLSTLRHMAVSFLITLQLAGRLPALCVHVCVCVLLHMLVCVFPRAPTEARRRLLDTT